MPSDANGNYSLPNGYLAIAGTAILPSEHNPPFEDVATGLTARLMRSGAGGMTGPLKLVDGTAAAPAESFTTDPTTGFYKTTDGIGVAVGGIQVAEFLAGGVKGARFLGELIPFTCTAAPALCVIPFGQTLLRASYPDLWAQAQIEITAGNTFYNNGDGSTTFGIGDIRGRVPAGWDSAGGTAANRLTTAGSSVNGAVIGSVGGLETELLTLAQLPAGITSSGSNVISVDNTGLAGIASTSSPGNVVTQNLTSGPGAAVPGSTAGSWGGNASMRGANTINVTANNTGGVAHPNVQPVTITNYILFAGA